MDLQINLTVEQSFQYRVYEQELENMSLEQCKELLLGATRLTMMRDNVIKSLMKERLKYI